MWFLKFYGIVLLYTILPLLLTYWLITRDSGTRPLKAFLGFWFLCLIMFPIMLLTGQISISINIFLFVFFVCIFWGLGFLAGVIFWGLLIIIIELVLFILRAILPFFKFSLMSYIFNKL